MERRAVIDLGTNTFHLLIVEPDGRGAYSTIYKERKFVKLAEEGIQTIGNAAYQRAVEAISSFYDILKEHQVNYVRVFGTAGLRTASNGQQFIKEVAERFGIHIELIDGREEARLIHKGVMQAIEKQEETFMIMDIGGGSVEFIIADDKKVYWAESFPIGVGVLYKEFHTTEPIPQEDIQNLRHFLKKILAPLEDALSKYPVSRLVGASGTFDVLEDILGKADQFALSSEHDILGFQSVYNQIMPLDLAGRLAHRSIPDTRAEMISVALELIDYILQMSSVNHIVVSAYALKEGMLQEM